jgi:hypothetical protein
MLIMLRQSRAPHADAAALPPPVVSPVPVTADTPTREDIPVPAVLAEPVPTLEEPVLHEPAPTRAEPVVAQAAAPEPDADTSASSIGEETDPDATREIDPDATRETAVAAGHEPVPTWPAPPLAQGLERGPVDSGLVAPPREFWGTDGEDEPHGRDNPLPPETDEDAAPFATAPFATVPQLNRVRATPVPPEEEDD